MELENIILSEVTQSQNEHTWHVLTDKWTFAQKFKIPMIQLTDHMKVKKKEKIGCFSPTYKREQNNYRR